MLQDVDHVGKKPPKELFEEHRYVVRQVVGFFAKKCGTTASYEELSQWGLIGLWDGCRRWKGPAEEFHYYAYSRVKGQILDELRRNGPFPRRMAKNRRPRLTNIDDEVPLVSEGTPVDELLHMKREIQEIVGNLSILTPNEQHIFTQHFMLDKPMVKIARSMGLSEPRISQLKRRAVEKLLHKTGIKPGD